MSYMPLNPYERYELSGLTEFEYIPEEPDGYDPEIEEIVAELEEIFDDTL